MEPDRFGFKSFGFDPVHGSCLGSESPLQGLFQRGGMMHSGGNGARDSGQVILLPFQFSHSEEEKCSRPANPALNRDCRQPSTFDSGANQDSERIVSSSSAKHSGPLAHWGLLTCLGSWMRLHKTNAQIGTQCMTSP